MQENVKDSSDQPVLGHIERLVAEEHRLYNQGTTTEADRAQLAKIQVELDQCWDLCGSAGHCGNSERTRRKHTYGPPKLLNTTKGEVPERLGSSGGTRTCNPSVNKRNKEGYLIDFAARLATVSY